jgi:maltooligosyltrehalose trehalohydrolase
MANVFGPCFLGNGRTRFALWAPAAEAVVLELRGAASLPMARQSDGWFAVETVCAVGSRYRFRLRDDLAIPDPASRAQDGDVHGWSVVIDPLAYTWRHDNWPGRPWHETVLYELHPGLMGGFAGIEARLPHLAELGITAVEFMPIADFPGGRN